MKLNLKSKLLFLALVPASIILVLSIGRVFYDFSVKENLNKTKEQIIEAKSISDVVHFMQRERGYSTGFLADEQNKKSLPFIQNRKDLDNALKALKKFPYLKENIAKTREDIDELKLSSSQAKESYTKEISYLLDHIKTMPTMVENLEDRNYLQAYSYLASAKEQLGRIRATLHEALVSKTLSHKNFSQTKESLKIYHVETNRFEKTLHLQPELLLFYHTTLNHDSLKEMFAMMDTALNTNVMPNAAKWFETATQSIDLFQTLEAKLFEDLQNSINLKIENANQNIILVIFSLALLLAALIYLMRTIIKKILSSTHILNEEFENSLMLLEQYKTTVDRSFIVSKTDPNGIIRYANKAFCDISGYSQEELLGKSHNIIRHPDMPEETFKEIWHTIKKLKKPWVGEVKNLAKNGSSYWMKAFINPILDKDGNVIEYIAIRTDITELQEDKERIRDTLGITTADFTEARHQVKEYENAINETWSVIRTDTNNVITYVNDTFIKKSGYAKEELMGKDCSELRDKKHKEKGDCEIVKQKLANKEVVHMQFENLTKEKTPCYMDTTIIPIANSNGEIIEHLHLMSDVTELVLIHQEIEKTQQEIIFRMGEIGESRNKETGNHVRRVANYARILALKSGLGEKEAELIADASPMHDIGKVAIPDAILLKPGSFEPHEWEIMKSHSVIGYKVLSGSQRPLLNASATIAHEHHEKYDGSGYPRGISGEDIHIYARIVAIADVFDALGADRVYKKAWELDEILKFFEEQKGKHFDPKLMNIFLENLNEFLEIKEKYRD